MSITIKLVRHGQSEANVRKVNPQLVGDFNVGLTDLGMEQARFVGSRIGPAFIQGALVYRSPYRRAVQTMNNVLIGAGLVPESVRVYEDPRLREVDHGYKDIDRQQEMRQTHGWFYYRYEGGESPADCFDRTSGFLEGLMRQARRKTVERVLLVTHGLTIRCFVMRFLHLTVDEFNRIENPGNADVVTLGQAETLTSPVFINRSWGVEGLRVQ